MDTTAKLAAFILTVLLHLRAPCRAGDERLIHQKFVNRFHPEIHTYPKCQSRKFVSSVSTSPICAQPGARTSSYWALSWGIDPMELFQMINGNVVPTRAVISGLAKELQSNVSLLTKLATEIKA